MFGEHVAVRFGLGSDVSLTSNARADTIQADYNCFRLSRNNERSWIGARCIAFGILGRLAARKW